MSFVDISREHARAMDDAEPSHRDLFEIPPSPADASHPAVYMTGNSLGLMPRSVRAAIDQELDDWSRLGVEAHVAGEHPWYSYHEEFRDVGARLVGAKPGEVVMMNSLTVNLHLMMVSFYRPTSTKRKILIEDDVFPSDGYAVQSQLRFHGHDPRADLIRLRPREGERVLRTEDVVERITRSADEIALALLPGVNYLTGQVLDMRTITRAAREAGVMIGWDLAHAAGNIPLQLHEWDVDFACWCSYKYLNAGPGAVAGCFVHERHASNTKTVRFAGWWGNNPQTRFEMPDDFVARTGADGWQLSNPPILAMAPLRVSLDIFDRVGMDALRARSQRLTGFLLEQIDAIGPTWFELITPREPAERGCQLSIVSLERPQDLYRALFDSGVIVDFRQPNVVRVAPVPLYNTYEDCWKVAEILRFHAKL